jgi:RNA polymerase sigma-70 factor (ECF subfamily)
MSFADLYTFAASRLPEPLRRLRVQKADMGDVIHDVVLVAHPKLALFQPRRLGAEDEVDVHRSLLAWLSAIAWRRVHRRRTRAGTRFERHVGDVAHLGTADDDAPTPEELAARARGFALALHVVRELRPERAEVLVLHDVGEMTVSEIADRLKVKANTVKSRLSRARRDAREVARRMDPLSAQAAPGPGPAPGPAAAWRPRSTARSAP